jgi:hypothetical protein
MREKYYERMSIVVTICTFYLVLAMVAWVWATRMSSGLREDQDKYVTRQLDALVGVGIDRMCDIGGAVKESAHDLHPFLIELHNVSYRRNGRTGFSEVESLISIFCLQCSNIIWFCFRFALIQVTGRCGAGSVTVVAGTGTHLSVRGL